MTEIRKAFLNMVVRAVLIGIVVGVSMPHGHRLANAALSFVLGALNSAWSLRRMNRLWIPEARTVRR